MICCLFVCFIVVVFFAFVLFFVVVVVVVVVCSCAGLTGESQAQKWAGNAAAVCGGCGKQIDPATGDMASEIVVKGGVEFHRRYILFCF